MSHGRVKVWMNSLLSAVALSTILFMSSCDHKELYVQSMELVQTRVDFDFSQVDSVPKAMRVLFYPISYDNSIGRPVKFDLSSNGGYVSLTPGYYNVLAYNVDAENVLEISDESYNDFNLSTRSYEVELGEDEQTVTTDSTGTAHARRVRSLFGSRVPKAEDEGEYLLYDTPDWTCCCRFTQFHVDAQNVTQTITRAGQPSLVLQANEAVYTIEVVIEGIEGIEWTGMVRGTLSGVPNSRQVAAAQPSSDLGMVAFSGSVDREREIITARFYVWGYYPPDDADARQYLNIYIWSNSGNYFISQDVSDQLRDAGGDDQHRVTVQVTSDLTLMDAAEGNSGFDPQVGEWAEQHTDLNLW